MHSRSTARNSRKRHIDNSNARDRNIDLLSSAAGDELPHLQSDNVVEEEKVKQYLTRLKSSHESDSSACIRLVLCDSEALNFGLDVQETLAADFGVSLVSLSEKRGLSIDRVIAIYGPLKEVARCALFIAFLLNARVNNVLKHEAFTLKLANYHLDVLVEATTIALNETLIKAYKYGNCIDSAPFQYNSDLHLATLRGDFQTLFNVSTLLFGSHAYLVHSAEETISLHASVRIHDLDFMSARSEEERKFHGGNKTTILDFVFNKEK